MIVEVDISDYYKAFINNANSDIEKYQEEYNINHRLLISTRNYLKDYVTHIGHQFNIDLKNDFSNSWGTYNEPKYDESEHLTDIIKLGLNDITGEDRIILLQLLRYSELLKHCDDCLKRITLAKNRTNITFKQYKEYLRKYYMQGVHKAIINGYAYRFSHGIGDLMINQWKYVNKVRDNFVDWAATNKRKQEILNAGLKLYNKDEAEIYKLRGIKYDGVPYIVYKTNKEYFDIELVNCKKFNKRNIKFKHANYIPSKFRGKTVSEIANMFNSVDEISVQDLGIRHKLITCVEKDPTLYLKYIRNVEQVRQRRGSHSTKNSKRADK